MRKRLKILQRVGTFRVLVRQIIRFGGWRDATPCSRMAVFAPRGPTTPSSACSDTDDTNVQFNL